MGLIDSVNKQNQLFTEVIEEEKNERLQNKNKQIRKNNYRMQLQQFFFKYFQNYDSLLKDDNITSIEEVKNAFDMLENRLDIIRIIADKNKNDEFAERELNLLYNKELNFVYNIFKKDKQAQTPDYKDEIYQGIQNTYKEHGIDAYYKLLDIKYKFLDIYNINTMENSQYFDKVNKHFKKYYTENAEEETPKNNTLIYIFTFIASIFVGSVAGFKTINKRKRRR